MADIVGAVALLMGCGRADIQRALYFGYHLVTGTDSLPLADGTCLDRRELARYRDLYGDDLLAASGYDALRSAADQLPRCLRRLRAQEDANWMGLAKALDLPPRILGKLIQPGWHVRLSPQAPGELVWMEERDVPTGNLLFPTGQEFLQRYLHHLIDLLERQDDEACALANGADRLSVNWPSWDEVLRRERWQALRKRKLPEWIQAMHEWEQEQLMDVTVRVLDVSQESLDALEQIYEGETELVDSYDMQYEICGADAIPLGRLAAWTPQELKNELEREKKLWGGFGDPGPPPFYDSDRVVWELYAKAKAKGYNLWGALSRSPEEEMRQCLLSLPIDEIGISPRICAVLEEWNIFRVSQLVESLEGRWSWPSQIRKPDLEEIRALLAMIGLSPQEKTAQAEA